MLIKCGDLWPLPGQCSCNHKPSTPPPGGEIAGSQELRGAGINAEEFAQLDYFFIPIVFNRVISLIVVSPHRHTIEYLDSTLPQPGTKCRIFDVIIRFLIHELGSLALPIWGFLHNRCPRQLGPDGCGLFTCFYAKALALNHTLNPFTDIGQGTTHDYVPSMKLKLVGDLLVDSCTIHTMPFGNVNHQQRHAPGSTSEPQYRLFWFTPYNQLADIHRLRSRTGLYDHMATRQDLVLWCLSRPPMLELMETRIYIRMGGRFIWWRAF